MPRGVARIPEPWEWVRTKECSKCHETKAWALFSPVAYWENGSVRRVQARCRQCRLEWFSSDAYKRYRERTREERRAYKRAWDDKQLAQRRRERGNRWDSLPVEPFRTWVLERFEEQGEGGWLALGDRLGVADRTLRRVITEQSVVSISLVDRCLTAVGEHLNDLYPDDQEMAA